MKGHDCRTWLGFLCESKGGVAQVHFGVVFAADVPDESVRLTDEGKMTEARYASIAELLRDQDRYEGWSRYVIGHLAWT